MPQSNWIGDPIQLDLELDFYWIWHWISNPTPQSNWIRSQSNYNCNWISNPILDLAPKSPHPIPNPTPNPIGLRQSHWIWSWIWSWIGVSHPWGACGPMGLWQILLVHSWNALGDLWIPVDLWWVPDPPACIHAGALYVFLGNMLIANVPYWHPLGPHCSTTVSTYPPPAA